MHESGELYLEECRDLVIDEIRHIIRSGTSGDERTYGLMLDYPLRRAKGLRPGLCIAVCRALGGELAEVLPSAAVLEIYHNAFLIHDDIEDGSLQRRGGPTLHEVHGTSVALNVGDGMLALTLAPLLANTAILGLGRTLRVLEIISRMVTISFEGQAQELRWIEDGAWEISDSDYEAMVLKKTGWYSFVAPARVGAVVARASDEVEQLFVSFATSIGHAFQIQDDLLNLERDRAGYGKEFAGDLWEGKRTLMLAHALRSASADERSSALAILSKPRPKRDISGSAAGLPELFDEMVHSGTIDDATREAMLGHLRGRAGTSCKTECDVGYLAELMDAHGSREHARVVAARHADAAEASWHELSARLPVSSHREFLGWLKNYVVRRER